MQINKIQNTSFGALDNNTRNWIFVTRNYDRVNTSAFENILNTTYRDNFIRTKDDEDGIVEMKICAMKTPMIGLPDIVLFKSEKGKPLSEILPILMENLSKINHY